MLLVGSVLSGLLVERADAQNVFRAWFDTVTVGASDTVTVNVYYTFTSTHPHNIDYVQLRFRYDSSEILPIGYDLDGTASAMLFDTTPSHLGITALGQSEIDTTNPVLLRIRFRVNPRLADTAFLHWDLTFPLFDASENVDNVIRQDGWIRAKSNAGHVVLSTPPVSVHGVTSGYSPDSVGFDLPIIVSNISSANVQRALLSFSYDSTVLSLQRLSVSPAILDDSTTSMAVPIGRQQVRAWLRAPSGVITGGDTVGTASFVALVGLDSICTELSDVSFRPADSMGWIGNTIYLGNEICMVGTLPDAVAQAAAPGQHVNIYPNPANTEVHIEDATRHSTIGIYDMLGRLLYEWKGRSVAWAIPSAIPSGIYHVIVRSSSGAVEEEQVLAIER